MAKTKSVSVKGHKKAKPGNVRKTVHVKPHSRRKPC